MACVYVVYRMTMAKVGIYITDLGCWVEEYSNLIAIFIYIGNKQTCFGSSEGVITHKGLVIIFDYLGLGFRFYGLWSYFPFYELLGLGSC